MRYYNDSECRGGSKWGNFFWAIVITALGILAIRSFSGCYSPHKLNKQLIKGQATYPTTVALFCGNTYPVSHSDSTRIEYRDGKIIFQPSDTITTVVNQHDTLVRTVTVNHYSTKTDTVYTLRTTTVENTAKIDGLMGQLRDSTAKINVTSTQLTAETHSRKFWQWFTVGLLALFALIIFIRFRYPKLIS